MLKMLYAPDHPKVVAARVRFCKNRSKSPISKSSLSFERYAELFANTKLTFVDIAKEAGVAEQTVIERYDRYFCELFGNVLASERLVMVMTERSEDRKARMAEIMTTFPWYEAVSVGAQSIGQPLHPYFTATKGKKVNVVSKSSVVIAEKRCYVHPIVTGHLSRRSCMRTGIVRLRRSALDGPHLFPVLIPKVALGTFVFLASDLEEPLGLREKEFANIYIPLKQLGTNRQSRLDCWPHLNDWSRLLQ